MRVATTLNVKMLWLCDLIPLSHALVLFIELKERPSSHSFYRLQATTHYLYESLHTTEDLVLKAYEPFLRSFKETDCFWWVSRLLNKVKCYEPHSFDTTNLLSLTLLPLFFIVEFNFLMSVNELTKGLVHRVWWISIERVKSVCFVDC